MTTHGSAGITPNANRLLWAGFMAILAAGIGFAIRSGLLETWRAEFGFTNEQVGDINGGGFTGFCFGIIIGGVLADIVGYGSLVAIAFALHVASAVVTFSVGNDPATAFHLLKWGSFIFAMANGALEAVANPLIATVFPNNRAHYLNILHASWPAGLILGGLAGIFLIDWPWQQQLALFLVPTALYGLMFLGQRMPKSEASAKGMGLGDMLKDVGILGGIVVCALFGRFLQTQIFTPLLTEPPEFLQAVVKSILSLFNAAPGIVASYLAYGIAVLLLAGIALVTRFSLGSPLMFVLFIAHAMVGAVELGTDGWIQSITGIILNPQTGKYLFVYTSLIMFLLRFCANFIEKNIGLSPVGILLVCAVLAALGLLLVSRAEGTMMIILALGIYALGKTFFWPTMLAVASDRFPRSGAVAISFMGGIGMFSAGLIGSPGLGYFKDKYSGEEARKADPAVFEKYKAAKASEALGLPPVTGLDGKMIGAVNKKIADLREADPQADAISKLSAEEQIVAKADIQGARGTLIVDAVIPASMAVIYLGLLLYFASIGGYRPVHIDSTMQKET